MQYQTNNYNFHIIKNRFKSCDVTLTYILFGFSCFLLISSFINFRAGHQSQTILSNLRNWHSSQIFQQYDSHLRQLLIQLHNQISKLTNLQIEQEKLFLRIQKNYLQQNQEQDEIEQIKIFQNKIKQIKYFIKKKKPEVEAFRNQYEQAFLKLKNQYQGRQSEGLSYFKQKGQTMITQAEQIQDDMGQILIKHQRWYSNKLQSQIKSQDQQLNEKTVIEYFAQTYQSRTEYKSMPPLAKIVLDPNPTSFLTYLYQKSDNLKQFIAKRQNFYQARRQLSKFKQINPSLSLIQCNMLSSVKLNEWNHQVFQQYNRLQVTYKLSQPNEQKSICVVVPSYNNNQQFRVQLNLNSIFSQNYTNYKVLIIDDASTDGTQDLIARYLKYYNIPEDKGQLIQNKASKKALQNIYQGTIDFCQNHQIAIIVDGDDELIGFNVLKVINAAYTKQKIGFLYSDFYYYQQSKSKVQKGFTQQYTDGQKQQNYRRVSQKFSHLITFKIELLKQVKDSDLKDQYGKFYDVAYDFALCYPLMELSCGHVKRLAEYQYLYNIGTGLNDFDIKKQHQLSIGKKILSQTPYQCAYEYTK